MPIHVLNVPCPRDFWVGLMLSRSKNVCLWCLPHRCECYKPFMDELLDCDCNASPFCLAAASGLSVSELPRQILQVPAVRLFCSVLDVVESTMQDPLVVLCV